MLAFLFWSAFSVYGQITFSGGSQLVISSGATVITNDITNSGGTIENNGDLSVNGNIVNNADSLFDSGSSGTVTFEGSSAQEITGTNDVVFFGTVKIDNSNGVALTNTSTGSDQTINGTLSFTSGKLTLNGFNLTLTNNSTGADASTGYIVTNGTGAVKRTVGSTVASFPVGNSAYNPVTLSNSGTSDTYGVKAIDHEPANANTKHMVNRSWEISEETAGGSNLSVTAQWNSGETTTDFDLTACAVGLTADAGTSYTWGAVDTASGTDPYTRVGTGFTGVGTFTVGDYYYAGITFDLKVILAGAYNTTNNNMDKTLNDNSLIPTTDPYGLSTTVAAVPAGAVDWVEVQLRSGTTPTDTIKRYARFVNQAGQVIEEDGSLMKVTGIEKNNDLYVSVHHRNHLPVMSASTVSFSVAAPAYNFTSNLAQAWDDATVTTNDAMKEVESGTWALWDGDATVDGKVAYNGAGNDRIDVLNTVGASTPGNTITNTYSTKDVNMDGNVNYNGGGNDRITILNVVGASTPGSIIYKHLPH